MPDNKQIAHGSDPKLISMSQDHEVRYWTKALGATKEQLQRAIDAVGNNADKVRTYLQKHRH